MALDVDAGVVSIEGALKETDEIVLPLVTGVFNLLPDSFARVNFSSMHSGAIELLLLATTCQQAE